MDRQLELFDSPKCKIDKKIRLIELFGGIGTQAMALRDIGADFERYKLVEFDKYAVQAYNAIHGTNFKPMDIKSVHGVDLGIERCNEFTYLLTYSFPCTDLSVAGKMMGMSRKEWKEGKSTRSGLLWEVERILEECNELPQVLLMENVPQVHGKKNISDFNSWIDFLKSKGYQNFWQDLNARDYGIPQNRVRCFMVSILSDGYVGYEFPKPVELKTVMKDYLEDEVGEKYYINSEKAQKLIAELIERGELPQTTDNRQQTTDKTRQDKTRQLLQHKKECQVVVLGNMDNTIDHTFESANRVYDKNNLCPTIPTCAGGGIQPKIIEETKCCVAMRGRNPDNPSDRTRGAKMEQRLEMNKDGLVNTLTTVQKDNLVMEKEKINKVGQLSNEGSQCGTVVSSEGLFPTLTAGTHGYANPHLLTQYGIRKLTPKECWRLMGYTDKDFEKASAVNSNTQLYKQAGNAIVKQVLMAIFSQMNIKGVKPWNDMTSEEKYNLIRKSTSGKKIKK